MKMPRATMVTPSPRMVIVGVYRGIESVEAGAELDHELVPILALRTTFRENDDGDDYVDHNDVLVWDSAEGQMVELRWIKDAYPVYELAVCPWDPCEDEQRLSSVIERLLKHAEERTGLKRRESFAKSMPALAGAPS